MYSQYFRGNEDGYEEITPKEWLIEIAILLLSIGVAMFFEPMVRDGLLKDVTRYQRALPITSQEQFGYAQETHVGDVLGYGDLMPTTPVTMPELTAPYAVVSRNHEHYTLHIYYTEDCSGSGDSRVCTMQMHEYWSWDFVGSERVGTDAYQFLGVKFAADHVGIGPDWRLGGNMIQPSYKPTDGGFVYQGKDDRYYFMVVPMKVTGTIYVNFGDTYTNPGHPDRPLTFYVNQTPDQIVAARKHMMQVSLVTYFIIVVLLFSGIYLFVAYEFLDIE